MFDPGFPTYMLPGQGAAAKGREKDQAKELADLAMAIGIVATATT